MTPAKPLDRAVSNIKYRLGKYYVRMGLTHVEIFPTPPLSHYPYVINEWPLTVTRGFGITQQSKLKRSEVKWLARSSRPSLQPICNLGQAAVG